MPKYVFVTGGVTSSLGKGITAASIGLAVQLAASWRTGILPLVLGAAASGSALAYNLFLSRTPLSPLPYLVSFGLLPVWIASGVGVPIERVLPAIPLVAPFAMAAHLAEIAPESRRGAYMGAYSMSLSIALTIGPWMGTQLLAAFGPVTVWSVMFVLGALAAVLMAYAAPRAQSPLAAAAAES